MGIGNILAGVIRTANETASCHSTRTVLHDLGIWTASKEAPRHLTDSVEVFAAACALVNAIQKYLDTLE